MGRKSIIDDEGILIFIIYISLFVSFIDCLICDGLAISYDRANLIWLTTFTPENFIQEVMVKEDKMDNFSIITDPFCNFSYVSIILIVDDTNENFLTLN